MGEEIAMPGTAALSARAAGSRPAREGEDGKKPGGGPVYVEDGPITKGHPLAGMGLLLHLRQAGCDAFVAPGDSVFTQARAFRAAGSAPPVPPAGRQDPHPRRQARHQQDPRRRPAHPKELPKALKRLPKQPAEEREEPHNNLMERALQRELAEADAEVPGKGKRKRS